MAVNPVSSNAPYSTAIIRQTVTFQTEQAKYFIGNWLSDLSVALFALDVISRKRLARLSLSTKQHKAATKALGKLFTDFEKVIKDDSARLEAVLKAQKITARADHNNPRSTDIEITTPELKRAIDLLIAFDNLIVLVDTVWLMGIMDTDEANQFRQAKSSQLKLMFRNIYKLSTAAKKSAYVQQDKESMEKIQAEEKKHGKEEPGANVEASDIAQAAPEQDETPSTDTDEPAKKAEAAVA